MNLLQRESFDIVAGDADTGEANKVLVQLARYGEVREVRERPGGPLYRETFLSMHLAPSVEVKASHTGEMVGHLDPASFRELPDPTAELIIADTIAGRDVLALIRNDTIRSVSVEFAPDHTQDKRRDDGTIERHNATLGAVAFAFRPAHDSPILALRELPPETETTMSETIAPVAKTEPVEVLTRGDLDEVINEFKRELLLVAPAAPDDPYAELRSFDSSGEMYLAAYDSADLTGLLKRALTDQITGNNPGVILPVSVQNIAGIVSRGRPAINAWGVSPLPPSGMTVDVPFFDGDLTALVGEQVTEKSDIVSVQVDIDRLSEDIKTFAGGSDISYQLIRRSSPSYVEAYLRIMALAYAVATDAEAVNSIAASGGTGTVIWDPATDDAATLRTAYFTASVGIETATGLPAEFVLAASDVFIAIGALEGLNSSAFPVQNTPGVSSARTLAVNVDGLPVIHDPNLAGGGHVISNSEAAEWYEDGPATVQADDVEKLGTNVAVWGMGIDVTVLGGGVVNIPAI